MADDLSNLRNRLDAIDARIVAALADREAVIEAVADAKRAGAGVVRDPRRESELLTRLVQRGRAAGLDGYYVARVFREVIDHSLRLQQSRLSTGPDRDRPLRLGHLGTVGSWSHRAAEQFGSGHPAGVDLEGFGAFVDMVEAVEARRLDAAVLPLENTTAGSVREAWELLASHPVHLIGEEFVRVEHRLVGLADATAEGVRRVYSHPQALAQCTRALRAMGAELVPVSDTAEAVARVAREQDPSHAAVASRRAADEHGLVVLRDGVANAPDTWTRFVVVSHSVVTYDPRIPSKTSIVIATRHEEGALLACLNVLAEHHLSLTKLESRPRPETPFEYLFYIDFEGHGADGAVREALRQLEHHTSFVKVLGSYPARRTPAARPVDAPAD